MLAKDTRTSTIICKLLMIIMTVITTFLFYQRSQAMQWARSTSCIILSILQSSHHFWPHLSMKKARCGDYSPLSEIMKGEKAKPRVKSKAGRLPSFNQTEQSAALGSSPHKADTLDKLLHFFKLGFLICKVGSPKTTWESC